MSFIQSSLNRLLWLVAVLVLASGAAFPEQREVVQFDPASTKVDFTLGDVLHTVHGTFRLKSGEIRFDPATGEATGALVVDAVSGDSGNGSRDRKMKRDILQTEKYPDIIFSPKHVSGALPASGDATLNVRGIFNIHGADHDMTLSVPVTVTGSNIAVRTQLVVPYVAWGMKNPSTFILRVNDKVRIDIAGRAHIAGATQAQSIR